jgi:hypothetical protein
MTSRYIPKKISKQVQEKHFFECAWCGTKLTERHHIKEFSEGGTHSIENLILLCPNCHTEVHKKEGNIKLEDLLNRKSTHLKGDRISGNLQFDVKECKIKMGQTFCQNFGSFVSFSGEKIIWMEQINNEYFLNCRFYSKNGDLVFWMSKNRYFAPKSFNILMKDKSIEITNSIDKSYYLKIWQIDDYLCLLGSNYHKGNTMTIDSEKMNLGGIVISGNGTLIGNGQNGLLNM